MTIGSELAGTVEAVTAAALPAQVQLLMAAEFLTRYCHCCHLRCLVPS